jgi:hypothetical protein
MLVQLIFGVTFREHWGAWCIVVLGVGYVGAVVLWCLSHGTLGYAVLGLGYVGAVDPYCVFQ